ncbi:Uncharacterised protein [Candidatus Tiddalikarchaeum anstoanum]|nr:Uncharacterised protein [Candidatus Tiddalikarchaeum anstoanum]
MGLSLEKLVYLHEKVNESLLNKKPVLESSNLKGKKLILLGYTDYLPFDTIERLSNYGIGKNNIYLVEVPQEAFDSFSKFNSYSQADFLSESLKKSTGTPESPCLNIAKLLFFEPYFMVPVADDSFKNEVRDSVIDRYVLSWIDVIGKNLDPTLFNDIVFFGGKLHVNYLELKAKLGRFNNLNYKIKIF